MAKWREMGLTDEEYRRIVEYLGREPNEVELGMCAVMWSEHCSYKSSKIHLKKLPTRGPAVVQGPGENAGVVDIGDGLGIAFKIESHNHPSAIEPYQGAATGVGGIIRDIFAMGARPIALLDSLRFGKLDSPGVRHLFTGVVAGIAGYGNCIGIPTVAGDVYFQESYEENPLVNAMCVGIVELSKLKKGVATGVGNPVLLVGATTGRDGIHGATFASEELSHDGEDKRPSVQVGDPFMEKLLLEACLEALEYGHIVGMQDLGAAGLTSSSSEMAARGKSGIRLYLDRVPLREEGMTPYEIMLSESQERMLLVVEKGYEDEIIKIFKKWDLNAVVVGEITDGEEIEVFFGGECVAKLPYRLLTEEAPVYDRPYVIPEVTSVQKMDPSEIECGRALRRLLQNPNIARKSYVYEQYDHQVGVNTVVKPGYSDAAVLRIKGTKKGIAVKTDGNGRYVYHNPREGAKRAVLETALNLAVTGAKPLGLTNCLNFGNPEKPEIMGQFVEVIAGMKEACEILNIPVTGGNVSFYNETGEKAIYPTPVIGMVGLIDDLETGLIPMAFQTEGDLIYLLGEPTGELGQSEFLKEFFGDVLVPVPPVDLQEGKRIIELLPLLKKQGLINSAHDVSDGGLAVSLCEAAFAGELGVNIDFTTSLLPQEMLFSEKVGLVIVSVSPEREEEFVKAVKNAGVFVLKLGRVNGKDEIEICLNGQRVIKEKLSELKALYEGGLSWALK
ncbi:phosphoribosylformylglycinamidine synthase [Carboxydothermus ferrireducens DSM 11255]|uniref:Phosphoribosylformylglycinamidine synthase subunit PurL n=2 Tax=Carboxydothermus TaxID=129957 RepID=A0ABX2R738_9THEO|nr:phosphoribosylformylglycinamidine synthase subunit PurL [Carboxydothermus ferrireducens]NYE56969.1 phosphoribosylformylglycinamidine synthase [Carboxydothermus ferrireducens DSM 11255]